jgi:general stress protein YciG
MEHNETSKKPRGFASMSPQRRSEIARLGGLASHKLGRAHVWTSEEASIAGRRGGQVSRRRSKVSSLSNTKS